MTITIETAATAPLLSSQPCSAPRFALGLGLSGSSALLATLAFGPTHIEWLVFVAFVPMIVAQHVVFPERWSGAAFAIGIAGFVTGYLYGLLDPSFAWWMRLIPICLGVPMFWWGRADRRFHQRTRYRWILILTPLVWTAGDFLRSDAPMAASRASLAYSLFEHPVLIQPVSITGIAGLNLLILMINWLLAVGVIRCLGPSAPPMPAARLRRDVVAVIAVAACWIAAGAALIAEPAAVLRVAAIQPGTSEGGEVEFARNAAQTRDAAARGAQLVVWREKTLDFDPSGTRGEEVRDLARETGAYLAIGYGIDTPEGQRNEATVISPDGEILGVYGKQHPAVMLSDDRTSISAGDLPVYDTPIGQIATIICYDLDFFDTARSMARNGAEVVAVPSWDPQGDTTKHYPLLVFRAVENRVTMVRAESQFASVIIDPHGRIIERAVTPDGSAATLVADVPLGSPQTVFVRFGPWFGWLTLVAAVAIELGSRRRPQTKRLAHRRGVA